MKKAFTGVVAGLATFVVVAQAADEPKKLWDHSVGLGFTLTRGNSDTLMGTANWLSQAKWDKNEVRMGADGTYGETDGARSAQSARGFGQYNRLFTDRFFGYARLEGSHDAVADIEYRVVVSPGVGYYFIKSAQTSLSAEVGPGWIFEKKGEETDNYMTIRFAERFEHKFNDKVRIWQSVEFLPQVEDWTDFIINAEIGLESMLSKSFSLRTYVQDTYQSEPAAGRKKNDVKLVTAVAYKF